MTDNTRIYDDPNPLPTDPAATAAPADRAVATEQVPPAAARNPNPWWRRRGLALAAIIAGGLLALGLAFGGGVALGWGLGAVSGNSVFGDHGRDGFGGGPGDRDGQSPRDSDDSTQSDSTS